MNTYVHLPNSLIILHVCTESFKNFVCDIDSYSGVIFILGQSNGLVFNGALGLVKSRDLKILSSLSEATVNTDNLKHFAEVSNFHNTTTNIPFCTSLESAQNLACVRVKVRRFSSWETLSTVMTGKPICLVQVDMTLATGLLLASSSAAHRSSVNVLLYW